MFSSALIAFTVLATFSGIAVRSAPMTIAIRQDNRPQACTGPKGTGVCFPLIAGKAFETGECNNVNGIQSLVFANPDDECIGFDNPDCEVGDSVAREFFNLNSDNIPASIKSLSCN